jgi:molecular chaperone GrpE
VVQVVQAGFTIGDRVLRPALVGVAKGGAKAAPSDGGSETGSVN